MGNLKSNSHEDPKNFTSPRTFKPVPGYVFKVKYTRPLLPIAINIPSKSVLHIRLVKCIRPMIKRTFKGQLEIVIVMEVI